MKTISYYVLIGTNVLLSILALVLGYALAMTFIGKMPREGELFVLDRSLPQKITVDAAVKQGSVNRTWTAFAQGGEEVGVNMLSGTELPLKQLGPTYIRLDHVFDDDYYAVVNRRNGQLTTDWTRLDKVLDSIASASAKPFISLSYMPSALAKTKVSQPNSWQEWQWLVEETITHISGKQGKNIEGVYYEVWNEPDLETFGGWRYYGNKNYLELYRASAQAAKQFKNKPAISAFKIGGPATTSLYKNWLMTLVEECQKEQLPLDFISWHRYALEPELYAQDIENARQWLGKTNTELVISEWGPVPERSEIYAQRQAGAHAVAVSRQLIGLNGLALAFEVKDGPQQAGQGWGLLAHEDFVNNMLKPRYKAFAFMQDMDGPRLAVNGETGGVSGWAVAKGLGINLILSSYQLDDIQSRDLPIEFVNLEPGDYRLQWENLSGGMGEDIFVVSADNPQLTKTIRIQSGDAVKIKLSRFGMPFSAVTNEATPSGFKKLISY